MVRNEVLEKLNAIFQDAFDRTDICISFDTTANDIEGWDSLMQMNLIEMIENEFDIQFTIDEVVGMEDVGVMVDIIIERM